MEPKLLVLKRFLQALDVPAQIDNLSDRKRVQKAVYLGQQLAEVDLGYRFNWYVMGPYSPDLTKDYYELSTSVDEVEDKDLRDDIKARLVGLRGLLAVPPDVHTSDDNWLEALASWHYLTKFANQDAAKARKTIAEKKPHLLSFIDTAAQRLASHA